MNKYLIRRILRNLDSQKLLLQDKTFNILNGGGLETFSSKYLYEVAENLEEVEEISKRLESELKNLEESKGE